MIGPHARRPVEPAVGPVAHPGRAGCEACRLLSRAATSRANSAPARVDRRALENHPYQEFAIARPRAPPGLTCHRLTDIIHLGSVTTHPRSVSLVRVSPR